MMDKQIKTLKRKKELYRELVRVLYPQEPESYVDPMIELNHVFDFFGVKDLQDFLNYVKKEVE